MYVYSITYETDENIKNEIVRADELHEVLETCKKNNYKVINVTHV